MAEQIGGYEAAEDEYFRARAADLRDLRDRVLRALAGGETEAALPPGAILLDADLPPSRFLTLAQAGLAGVALEEGSPAAHVAMLARSRGVPMVTGLGPGLPEGGTAVLDGDEGVLILYPSPETRAHHAARAAAEEELPVGPALTATGEPVEVMLNLDDPSAVGDAILRAADGVGLLRTEFLFTGRDSLPGEAEQLAAYRALLDRLDGRPLVVRTLDVGGDKPPPGVSLPRESNPFLGLRGIRLCLERPELLLPQARALLRATPGRPLRVMLPMVATAAEVAEATALFERCLAELRAAGIEAAMPPLGVMVETPAAALTLDLMPAAFASLGTNDLTQYAMAAARDAGGRVAALNDGLQPGVLRLVGLAVAGAKARGIPLSVCGDMASDPRAAPALLGLGIRRLSVAPAALGRVRRAVAAWSGEERS
jgi:phosphotransferase system enzyme I (PtsI)